MASATLIDAHRALEQHNYELAHRLAMAHLQKDPQYADAYFVMALIAYRHQKIRKAEDVVGRALRFAPNNIDYQIFRCQCLLELSERDQARDILAEIVPADSDDKIDSLGGFIKKLSAHQSDSLGVVYSRLGFHETALPYFKHACECQSDNENYRYNLASCLQFSGDFAAAEEQYERAISSNSKHYRSHSSLSQLKKQSLEQNHLKRLENLWQQLGDSDADAYLHIGHALAKEYEDLGNYDRAFHYLFEGKRRKRKQVAYDPSLDRRVFESVAGLHESLKRVPESTCESSAPIFIVGMPRTGTTLIERILSSHSRIESAGELANFSNLVKRGVGTESPWVLDLETVEKSGGLDFSELGRRYLETTESVRTGLSHFIDKMPLNFLYMPLILKALPNAKIICLQRNPMDTCLSNYRQLFSTQFSYYNYSLGLSETAQYYAAFDRLLGRYRQQYPDQWYSITYETVVDNLEQEARALLDYCELPWESQCLDFHNNSAPVATASSVQVREKIYRRGVERWRHYDDHLSDLKAVFDRENIRYN